MDTKETIGNNFNFEDLLPDAETVECEDLFSKAWKLYELDKVRKCVGILTTVIKRNPGFGKTYSLLGKIYEFKYRDYETAEKYYLAGINASPNYRLGYKNYFYFLRIGNRFEEAKQYIEKWSKLGVDAESVAYEYGWLLEAKGDIEQAIRYYQKAATLAVTDSTFNEYTSEYERCKRKLEMSESDDD